MTAADAGEGINDAAASTSSQNKCSRCDAGATVMQMVQHQALCFAALSGHGDGEPPAALWEAVWAEDWPTVRSEWEKWVSPALRELHGTARDWRATVAVMAESAARVIGQPFPADIHDPVVVQRQWGRWIVEQFTAARESVRSDEWAAYSQALPAELHALATEHPTRQAELAATTFKVEELHRNIRTDQGGLSCRRHSRWTRTPPRTG